MKPLHVILVTVLALALGEAFLLGADRHTAQKDPYYQARQQPTGFFGPAQANASLDDLDAVLLGFFGPNTPPEDPASDMWQAACLAIEQANKAGGYCGVPFRLVTRWADNPWGSGVKQVVRMAYQDRVWALVGGPDGASTHLAEQVVAKAFLCLVSPACTDKSVNLAHVPWMFSCLPQDHVLAPVLAEAVAQSMENGPLVQVSAVDHDSHLLAVELKKAFQLHNIMPAHHFEFRPGQLELSPMIRRVIRARPSVLALLANAQESARVLRALRTAGCEARIFGGPWMGQGDFLREAGDTAEGVVFPRLFVPMKASAEFRKAFMKRTGRQPDYLSAHTYDALRLIIRALHQSGLNRAALCQALKAQSGYTGVTGSFQWDKLGSNTRPVGLGIVQGGAIKAYGAPEASGNFRSTQGPPP
jgi:branched-chain amino acid transport system substrate-binding protein